MGLKFILQKAKNFLNNVRGENIPFPENIIVTAPHGSARVPLKVFTKLTPYYQLSPRLLLNYSDYGTHYFLEDIPPEHRVIAKHGRLVGDINRSIGAPDLIRYEDFGGNPIFKKDFRNKLEDSIFRFFLRRKMLSYSYSPFYKELYEKIEKIANNKKIDEHMPIIHIDLHDVGNLILGRSQKEDHQRKNRFPKVVISNAPDLETGENTFGTAPDYFMNAFISILSENLELKKSEIKKNYIYNGGHLIRVTGNYRNNSKLARILKGRPIISLQVEFDRGLYLKESTQRPYYRKVQFFRKGFMKTLHQIGKFSF